MGRSLADATFAMNMDLDEPRERRRAAIRKVAAELGPFRTDETRPPVSDSPFHVAWWLRGERGRVRLAILLSPEPRPRLQSLAITGRPRSVARLEVAAGAVVAATNEPAPVWPADLGAAPTSTSRRSSARCGPRPPGSAGSASARRSRVTARRPPRSRRSGRMVARSW